MCNIVVFALVFAYFWLFELAGFEELRNACGQVDVYFEVFLDRKLNDLPSIWEIVFS